MNRSCRHIQRRIPLAILGDLDESARAAVLKHAYGCAECAKELAFQRGLRTAIEREPLPAPPPTYFTGVLDEIHQRLPAPPAGVRPPRHSSHRKAVALAAIATLAFLLLGSFLFPRLSSGLRAVTHPVPTTSVILGGSEPGQ